MKRIILFLFLGLLAHSLFAQQFSSDDPAYKENVEAGEKALNAEQFDDCIDYYEKAFAIKQTSYLSTLRAAACAFSAKRKDLYKQYLDKAFELSWDETKHIFDNYPEFEYLQDSKMAKQIQDRYEKAAVATGLDLELMTELKEIRRTDQLQRQQMGAISEKYGWQSPQMDSLWTLQLYSDSVNTARICEIIDTRGYPGKSLVGDAQASTAFLVIQHADIDVQEKYLDVITKAADAGEVAWSSVALLIDRVNLRKGAKQIYGSQISRDQNTGEYYFAPIENPMKVDSIRATVGLGPLQKYADNWNFKWDPKKHIERHKEQK